MSTTTPIQTPPRPTFADYSHPEADERPKSGKQLNGHLRGQLRNYKAQEGLSNDALARRLGYKEGTPVSKYINGTWDRSDLSEFEASVESFLVNQGLRQRIIIEPMRTSVVRQVENVLDSVRQTGTTGVIHGEAGLGKTTGVRSYAEKNPNAIVITANRIQNDERGFIRLLMASVGHHHYKHGKSYWDCLVAACKGTERLIIIDHAQRLSKAAIDTAFDFSDQTGCPIGFVGNPRILEKIATDENNHSRALKEYPVSLDRIPDITRHILSHFVDDFADIEDAAIRVVKRPHKGRLRALAMLLRSATDLARDPDLPGGFPGAFQVALSESIQHKS